MGVYCQWWQALGFVAGDTGATVNFDVCVVTMRSDTYLVGCPCADPGCLAPLSVHLTSKQTAYNLFSCGGWDWWVRLSLLWQKTQVTEKERKKNISLVEKQLKNLKKKICKVGIIGGYIAPARPSLRQKCNNLNFKAIVR